MTTVNKEPGERIITLGKKGQTMELPVPMPPEYMASLERQIADLSERAFKLEAEKREVVRPINEAIKEVKAQESALLAQRESKTILVPIEVEVRADLFRGEKWVVRKDTWAEVPDTRRALTDEDRQATLPGVVVDGEKDTRPDAEVLPLFGASEENPTAAAPETTSHEEVATTLEPVPEGGLNLYMAGDHPGWAAYVHAGHLFIRPPNVDRFEPPRSPKDKGPLLWDPNEERFDGARGANVTSEWLTENDALLGEFDLMKMRGKISEPVAELPLKTPTPREDAGFFEERRESAGADTEVPALAKDLTDNGRKILRVLVEKGPDTAARLGTSTNCRKPGAALNHLSKQGLVEKVENPGDMDDTWTVTDLGRKVHEARAALEK